MQAGSLLTLDRGPLSNLGGRRGACSLEQCKRVLHWHVRAACLGYSTPQRRVKAACFGIACVQPVCLRPTRLILPCRSSTQKTSSCCVATTNALRSTESMGFMMSASGGTISGCGRPSRTALTACRWRRWLMRRWGGCDVWSGNEAMLPQLLCLCPCSASPRCQPVSQALLQTPPCCLCCRSYACTAVCRRSSSPWSRLSGFRGPQMYQIQACCAICCGQIQTRTCRQALGRLATRGPQCLPAQVLSYGWPLHCVPTAVLVGWHTLQGWGENDRGVSYTFGPDSVTEFLQKHDLDLICRAHQVKWLLWRFSVSVQHNSRHTFVATFPHRSLVGCRLPPILMLPLLHRACWHCLPLHFVLLALTLCR